MKTITQKPGRHSDKEKQDEFSVFIADDDQAFLFALAFHLKKEKGWKVYGYPSAEDCLYNLHLNPDAIVLDYFFDMNRSDGLKALKEIKSRRPDIPVIILSAQDNIDVSVALLKAGAFTYIVKDREALAAIGKTLLSIYQAKQ